MCFSTENVTLVSGIPERVAQRLNVVTAQAPSEAAQRSVGEKLLPSPPLSRGAWVRRRAWDGSWSSSVAVGETSFPVMRTLISSV